jgi:hypothetical protein
LSIDMQLIRAGVDSLYLAIMGTLPTELLAQLAEAKAQAAKDRREAPVVFTHSGIKAMVQPTGQRGGYAYVFHTGPFGARFACTEASDRQLYWNFFVKPHATALLTLGFGSAVGAIFDTLAALGARVAETSLNRIDYALDIRADDFILDLERFIAHPKATRSARWGETDIYGPSAVLSGRRLESFTIGKMPGKQVILYDKTAEVRGNQYFHWFEAWQIEPENRQARVWRLELRLGSHELKMVRRLRILDNLRTGLRPALCELMQRVRYVAAGEIDTNVSRRRPDPIWQLARHHIETADLLGGAGDLPPERLIAITRDMKIECHKKLIIGNAAGLAAHLELDDAAVEDGLADIVGRAIGEAVPSHSFHRSLTRARERRDVMFGPQP